MVGLDVSEAVGDIPRENDFAAFPGFVEELQSEERSLKSGVRSKRTSGMAKEREKEGKGKGEGKGQTSRNEKMMHPTKIHLHSVKLILTTQSSTS